MSFEWSGNGVDYNSAPIKVTFSAGATSTTINIFVINDTTAEGSETFDLSLTIPASLREQVILGANSKAIANITDDTSKKIG